MNLVFTNKLHLNHINCNTDIKRGYSLATVLQYQVLVTKESKITIYHIVNNLNG